MIHSVATPGVTVGGIHELRRSWKPAGEPFAEVVIVHGLGEHSGRYERTGGLIAEAGLSVRSFDLIGMGASGGRRGDIDDWAHLLDQVGTHVETAGQNGLPVVLLGHSLGGLLATEYALSERPPPDLLVVSAPALAAGAAWQRRLFPVIGGLVPTLMVPTGLKGEQLSRDPAVGEAYFADPLVQTKSSARFLAQFDASMTRTMAALGRLNLTTLVIHGGADTIVLPTASVGFAEVPNARRRLYPTLRHESFNEPEGPEVVAEVVAWIKEQLSQTG